MREDVGAKDWGDGRGKEMREMDRGISRKGKCNVGGGGRKGWKMKEGNGFGEWLTGDVESYRGG